MVPSNNYEEWERSSSILGGGQRPDLPAPRRCLTDRRGQDRLDAASSHRPRSRPHDATTIHLSRSDNERTWCISAGIEIESSDPPALRARRCSQSSRAPAMRGATASPGHKLMLRFDRLALDWTDLLYQHRQAAPRPDGPSMTHSFRPATSRNTSRSAVPPLRLRASRRRSPTHCFERFDHDGIEGRTRVLRVLLRHEHQRSGLCRLRRSDAPSPADQES